MKASDLHLIFDPHAERCKVFRVGGQLACSFEMRNRTVSPGQFGHWGNCPPGTYELGGPVDTHDPAFGLHFTPVLGTPGRSGIGIHGGGSGQAHPFSKAQGWVVTHGCFRVQNQQNEELVLLIRGSQDRGGACWLTVL